MNFPRLAMGTLSFSLTGQLDFPDLGSAWHLSMMSRILQIPKDPFSMASWTIWNDYFNFLRKALCILGNGMVVVTVIGKNHI
jgi:hypothetical protein